MKIREMDTQDDTLSKLRECVENGYFLEAFSILSSYASENLLYSDFIYEIDTMRSHYNFMLNCYENAYEDTERDAIFKKINNFLNMACSNCFLNEAIKGSPVLAAAKKRAANIDLRELPGLAMQKKGDMEYYNTLFSAVLVSWQWDTNLSDKMRDFMDDEDTDSHLAALLISAMTLSCLCVFDVNKFHCLIHLHETIANPFLKERAFVGWAICLGNYSNYQVLEVRDIFENLLRNKELASEMVELQKQIIICMDADKQKDILTDKEFMRLAREKMNDELRNDLDETPLDEILHPENDDHRLEQIKKAFMNVEKRKKDGNDVYFSGFSKMKSFVFFHRLSNWFLPFFLENPALAPCLRAFDGDEKTLRSLQDKSPFCESDKYSLAFGLEMTLNSAVPSVKKLLKDGTGGLGASFNEDTRKDSTCVRRLYLHDLYRFFSLSSFAKPFSNPFANNKKSCGAFLSFWTFTHQDGTPYLIGGEFLEMRVRIARFLAKRKDYARINWFLNGVDAANNKEVVLLKCLYFMNVTHSYEQAMMLLAMSRIEFGDCVDILKPMIKCNLELGNYNNALKDLQIVQKLKPSSGNQLKIAYCKLKNGKIDEALPLLYELYYKHSDNLDVLRSLAWANLLKGNYENALKTYDKLIEDGVDSLSADDIYNKGICYWLMKDVKNAIACFRKFGELIAADSKSQGWTEKITDDLEFLSKYITVTEVLLMRDCLVNNGKSDKL